MPEFNATPKGTLVAICHQRSSTSLYTGMQYREDWHIGKVTSASRDGLCKTYILAEGETPRWNDRYVTVFTLPASVMDRAGELFGNPEMPTDREEFVAVLKGESLTSNAQSAAAGAQ